MKYYKGTISLTNGQKFYGEMPTSVVLGYEDNTANIGYFSLPDNVNLSFSGLESISETEFQSSVDSIIKNEQDARTAQSQTLISQLKDQFAFTQELQDRLKTADEKYKALDLTTADLQTVKVAKIAQLAELEQQASSTFQSSALGTVHTYLSDEKSMGKMNGEHDFINGVFYDNEEINWYTLEEGGVIHTKDQFNQAWLDGRKALRDNFNRWDSLEKQVKACTSNSQIDAINW